MEERWLNAPSVKSGTTQTVLRFQRSIEEAVNLGFVNNESDDIQKFS